MMLFERARWPVNERPEVADAPCCGVRSVVTPGVMTEKLMKLRPLIGRLSICCRLSTDDTAVFVTSTTGESPVTVTCSAVPATDNRKSTRDGLAEEQHDARLRLGREARRCGGDRIRSRRERGGRVAAPVVGRRRPRDVGVDVRHRDGDTRQDRPRLIDDGTLEIGAGQSGLRKGGGR